MGVFYICREPADSEKESSDFGETRDENSPVSASVSEEENPPDLDIVVVKEATHSKKLDNKIGEKRLPTDAELPPKKVSLVFYFNSFYPLVLCPCYVVLNLSS